MPVSALKTTSPNRRPRPPVPTPHRLTEATRWLVSRAGQWTAVFTVGLGHLWTLSQASLTGWLPLQLLCYLAPAAAVLTFRPASRRRAYRFLAPLMTAYVALPGLQVMAYLAVFCWVIRQSWFIDARPTDPTIRQLLRPARQETNR